MGFVGGLVSKVGSLSGHVGLLFSKVRIHPGAVGGLVPIIGSIWGCVGNFLIPSGRCTGLTCTSRKPDAGLSIRRRNGHAGQAAQDEQGCPPGFFSGGEARPAIEAGGLFRLAGEHAGLQAAHGLLGHKEAFAIPRIGEPGAIAVGARSVGSIARGHIRGRLGGDLMPDVKAVPMLRLLFAAAAGGAEQHGQQPAPSTDESLAGNAGETGMRGHGDVL